MSTTELPDWMARAAADLEFGRLLELRRRGLSDGSLFSQYPIIAVFEHGMLQGHPEKADAYKRFRWDEVAVYRTGGLRKYVNGVHRSTRYDHHFRLEDGRDVQIFGVSAGRQTSAVADLAEVVGPLIAARQLPGLRAELAAGEPVDFGGLLVAQDGLTRSTGFFKAKAVHLPWPELDGIDFHQGAMRIRTKGAKRPWVSYDVGSFPNLDAFLTLAEAFAAANGGRVSREGSRV